METPERTSLEDLAELVPFTGLWRFHVSLGECLQFG